MASTWPYLADELGDTAERDATLGKLAAPSCLRTSPKVDPVIQPLLDFSKWLAKAYQQPADSELDMAALDEILKTDQKQAEVNVTYFLGRFYYDRKQPDLARKYLEQCTSSGRVEYLELHHGQRPAPRLACRAGKTGRGAELGR